MTLAPELAAVTFGICASLSWGVSDFSGGLATKRFPVIGVVTVAHIIGLVLMILLAVVTGEAIPPTADFIWGGLAGLAGLVGMAALYRALASGRMGLVAPTASVLSVALSASFGILLYGIPAPAQIAGFALGILSVWFISSSKDNDRETKGLGLAVIAGTGFAAFFILIDRISSESLYWPLTVARVASVTAMVAIMLLSRQRALPRGKPLWTIVVIAGFLDVAGNVFFALATQAGRLDIAAVVSSLYPAITVILARIVLKEQISRVQAVGVITALAAISLIVVG
jgi:drug/metabolite transporter (DMT)-like permease